MDEKIRIKTERDAINDEDRSDVFNYPIDIKYDPLAIKQELAEITEFEDGSVQVGNIFIAKAEIDSDIKTEEIVERNCDICRKCYVNGLDFVAHRYTHTKDTRYTCCICNCNTFHHKPDLHRHILNVHFNLTSKPPSSAKLNTPKACNTIVKPYQCGICNRRFNSNFNLTVHGRSHSGEKPYKCDICNNRFITNSNLTVHSRIHSGEKPYGCDVCNKRFITNSDLIVHNRIHSGVKPYECNVCQKSFTQTSALTRHKFSHFGEKPFKCDTCNKRFISNSHLTIHTRIHSDVRLYECNVCQKSFTRTSTLSKHKLSHSTEKPYKCDICLKAFNRTSNLTRHRRSHRDLSRIFS